eukprot:1794687-Pyramimonas_sp.AAC.2
MLQMCHVQERAGVSGAYDAQKRSERASPPITIHCLVSLLPSCGGQHMQIDNLGFLHHSSLACIEIMLLLLPHLVLAEQGGVAESGEGLVFEPEGAGDGLDAIAGWGGGATREAREAVARAHWGGDHRRQPARMSVAVGRFESTGRLWMYGTVPSSYSPTCESLFKMTDCG